MKHAGGRPRTVRWCDVQYARDLHALGRSWAMIAEMLGYPTGALKAAVSRLARDRVGYPVEPNGGTKLSEPTDPTPNPSEGQ